MRPSQTSQTKLSEQPELGVEMLEADEVNQISPQNTKKAAVDVLLDAYKNEISEEDTHCLSELEKKWKRSKPLVGRKVLLNGHLTLITLKLIRILMLAGAEVDVTATPVLATHENAVNPIREAQLEYYEDGNIPLERRKQYYDVVYDCGAGMLDTVVPRIGMVELTHTDPKLYENISFPVITVDNSRTKEIETFYGTGDALVRVLTNGVEQIINTIKSPLFLAACANMKVSEASHPPEVLSKFCFGSMNIRNLFDRKYMVFGYGKVGKGIAAALRNSQVPAENIFVVEVSEAAYNEAQKEGYQALRIDASTEASLAKSLAVIKEKLWGVYAAVTATGVEGAISTYFSEKDFEQVPLLINMGTPDEFGGGFSAERVLNNKKPANFMLDRPTEIQYLDPIFDLLAEAIMELLRRLKLKAGLQAVSSKTDEAILNKWNKKYKNEERYTNAPGKIDKLLKAANNELSDVAERSPQRPCLGDNGSQLISVTGKRKPSDDPWPPRRSNPKRSCTLVH